MATTRATARRLCTAREYELVQSSFPPAINALDRKALGRGIARARRLRDKARTQAEERTREIAGRAEQRRSRPARSNTLTVAKQKLFDETLARFEKRLQRLEAQKQRRPQGDLARKALASKRAAEAGGEQRPSSRSAGQGMAAKPARDRKKGHFPAEGAKKGVRSAAIKRGQARRDSR